MYTWRCVLGLLNVESNDGIKPRTTDKEVACRAGRIGIRDLVAVSRLRYLSRYVRFSSLALRAMVYQGRLARGSWTQAVLTDLERMQHVLISPSSVFHCSR